MWGSKRSRPLLRTEPAPPSLAGQRAQLSSCPPWGPMGWTCLVRVLRPELGPPSWRDGSRRPAQGHPGLDPSCPLQRPPGPLPGAQGFLSTDRGCPSPTHRSPSDAGSVPSWPCPLAHPPSVRGLRDVRVSMAPACLGPDRGEGRGVWLCEPAGGCSADTGAPGTGLSGGCFPSVSEGPTGSCLRFGIWKFAQEKQKWFQVKPSSPEFPGFVFPSCASGRRGPWCWGQGGERRVPRSRAPDVGAASF